MSALPLILRGIYTTGWKYTHTPPYDYQTEEEVKDQVKSLQSQYGEQEINWGKSTEDIISIVLDSLERYFTDGQLDQHQKPVTGKNQVACLVLAEIKFDYCIHFQKIREYVSIDEPF